MASSQREFLGVGDHTLLPPPTQSPALPPGFYPEATRPLVLVCARSLEKNRSLLTKRSCAGSVRR